MKILFASDSFKGSLTSEKIIVLLTEAAHKVFPGCETYGIPIADGGEGTTDAVLAATSGTRRTLSVHDPLMEMTKSTYGVLDETSVIIEMAAASGLPLVPVEKRNPLYTSSTGTGELIRDALSLGYRDFSIAIGGSATNDGGMGAMAALGVRFLDEAGRELCGTGENLMKVADIDISGIHPAVAKSRFTVMCDVNNPLTGPTGATYTFGAQKGGSSEILDQLELGMEHYAAVLTEKFGVDPEFSGAGAAGGLGAALRIFLQAEIRSGIDTILDLILFDEKLEQVDLVITGEGRIDWQSAFGKVPSGVGKRCQAKGIPVVAVVGGMGEGAEHIYDYGVDSIIPTISGAMDIQEAMVRAEDLYRSAAERMFRMVRVGMNV